MAVDRPGQYYNPPDNYHDPDGNLKTFTYIDYDKKKIPMGTVVSQEELKEINEGQKTYKEQLIERILAVNAGFCPLEYSDYTVRGANVTHLTWNEAMLRDSGVGTQILRDLVVILENRVEQKSVI